jgi:hypothetical protein
MSDEFAIDIGGIEETIAMLNKAPGLIAKNAFARALTAVGDRIKSLQAFDRSTRRGIRGH